MAMFFADLVREASWGEGTGALALQGALPGHRAFADAVPPGARFPYCIAGISRPEQWETGEGEIADGALIRTPLASSNGGAAVAFAPGLKTIALTVTADWLTSHDDGGVAAIEDIEGLGAALAGKANSGHDHDERYSAAMHGHGFAELTGKPTTLAGYGITDGAPAVHGHDFAELTGKPTTLAGYGIADAAAAGHHHDGSYQPSDAQLSALAGLAGGANKLPYFTGVASAAQTDLSGFGRSLIDDADAAAGRATLELGTMATQGAGAVTITGGTASGLTSLQAGALRAVNGGARIEGNGSGITGAGVGFEIFTNAGSGYLSAYNRTSSAYAPIVFMGATSISFQLSPGGTIGSLSSAGLAITGHVDASTQYRVGAVKVLGARATGWAGPSGTATRTTFDTASVTTVQLAERVKALIDDLVTHGLIGA